MPPKDKSAPVHVHERKAGPAGEGSEPSRAGRPAAGARAWTAVSKLQGPSKKFEARQKLPAGPLGGSGRKTNRSRSS